VDALTHLNYAFAYIDPESFDITTMDGLTDENLFGDVAELKDIKKDLKVWISIGGWTFSDNDTTTQPVFGNIARTSANREKFAKKLLSFLDFWGFDGTNKPSIMKKTSLTSKFETGVDLDWEYPGAPDRGGREDDTANYVLLMKTIRSVFNTSGRKLGISFTAPSSYWYLRWFDLPGLSEYVDWINLMTYDLHGTWDSSNPIGNVVQGHTNLTEIEHALELFWYLLPQCGHKATTLLMSPGA
jgi:chitinase